MLRLYVTQNYGVSIGEQFCSFCEINMSDLLLYLFASILYQPYVYLTFSGDLPLVFPLWSTYTYSGHKQLLYGNNRQKVYHSYSK